MRAELYDVVLERQVLGSCLLKGTLLYGAELTEDDFYSEAHRQIWLALTRLHLAKIPINTLTLRSQLLDDKLLGPVGGDEFLLGLTDTIPQEFLPVDRVRRLARLRGVRVSIARALAACDAADLDGTVLGLAEAHQAAMHSVQRRRAQNALELCLPLLEELAQGTESIPRIHPGYDILEEKLGSIPEGCTIAILASTNVGKSSFALEMLLRAAKRNVSCGYLSVEDQEPVVRSRVLAMLSGVSSRKILHRRIDDEDFRKLAGAYDELRAIKERLHVSILQGGTDADVCAAMTDLASRGVKMVAVDYLQKITSSRTYANKAHEMSAAATRITSHAQRLGLVCVLVSQCTRDKTKLNECPSKHDMKESGDLENMVDAIVGLWREYEDDLAPVWARLLKVKWGGVGLTWRLQRDPYTGRLEEAAGSDAAEVPTPKPTWKRSGGEFRPGI